jgi:hypothetical protein
LQELPSSVAAPSPVLTFVADRGQPVKGAVVCDWANQGQQRWARVIQAIIQLCKPRALPRRRHPSTYKFAPHPVFGKHLMPEIVQ